MKQVYNLMLNSTKLGIVFLPILVVIVLLPKSNMTLDKFIIFVTISISFIFILALTITYYYIYKGREEELK